MSLFGHLDMASRRAIAYPPGIGTVRRISCARSPWSLCSQETYLKLRSLDCIGDGDLLNMLFGLDYAPDRGHGQ